MRFLNFSDFFRFFLKLLRLLLKVTEVTTDQQKLPKFGPNCMKKLFFCPKGHHLFPFHYYSTVMVGIGPVIPPTGRPSCSSKPSLISKRLDSTSTTLLCCSRVPYIWLYSTPWASLFSPLVKNAFTASQCNKCDCWSSWSRFEHLRLHLKSPLNIEEKLHLKFLVIALRMLKRIFVISVVKEKLFRYGCILN